MLFACGPGTAALGSLSMTEPREEQARKQKMPPAAPDDDVWADDDEDDLEPGKEVHNDCRCGQCCHLLIETDLEDAKREPKIAERGSPIYLPAEVTESGKEELIGHLLNTKDNGYACTFLDRSTNLCSIYENQP
jgi:hypothetical protein